MFLLKKKIISRREKMQKVAISEEFFIYNNIFNSKRKQLFIQMESQIRKFATNKFI